MASRVRETEIAADQSHVFLHTVGPRNLDELEAAFADLLSQRPDALLVTTEAFTRRYQARILDFANGNKIPAMFEDSSYVEAGGLMSYGPDYRCSSATALPTQAVERLARLLAEDLVPRPFFVCIL